MRAATAIFGLNCQGGSNAGRGPITVAIVAGVTFIQKSETQTRTFAGLSRDLVRDNVWSKTFGDTSEARDGGLAWLICLQPSVDNIIILSSDFYGLNCIGSVENAGHFPRATWKSNSEQPYDVVTRISHGA